jgi:hypothetical protein
VEYFHRKGDHHMIIKANKLRERGLPASKIRQFCHMQGSPFFQSCKGGTWWCETEKFDKFLDKLAKEKD